MTDLQTTIFALIGMAATVLAMLFLSSMLFIECINKYAKAKHLGAEFWDFLQWKKKQEERDDE